MYPLILIALMAVVVLVNAEVSKVCKCDGVKCGEVKLLTSLVPLATKWAGLKEGGCEKYIYTEKTGEVLKVKTPIGTIESPVYVKKIASDLRKRLENRYKRSYMSKVRKRSKLRSKRPLKPAPITNSPPDRTYFSSSGRIVYSVPRVETFIFSI